MAFVLLAAPKPELIDWHKYDASLIKQSEEQGKPVLIKFTAEWCLSCKVVDKLVFSQEDVAQLLKKKGVVAVKADTTVKDYPATAALRDVYKETGIPFTVLIVPGRDKDYRFRGVFGAEEFTKILKTLPEAK
jgi:thiol:disulfide interchange protein